MERGNPPGVASSNSEMTGDYFSLIGAFFSRVSMLLSGGS
jgi:hypothetical protein